jgi:hypothetical protein
VTEQAKAKHRVKPTSRENRLQPHCPGVPPSQSASRSRSTSAWSSQATRNDLFGLSIETQAEIQVGLLVLLHNLKALFQLRQATAKAAA